MIEVLNLPRFVREERITLRDLADLLDKLASASNVDPEPDISVFVRNPQDDATLGGPADHLVTGDADLLIHQGDPRLGNLEIVTVPQFLAILESSSD